MKNIWKTGGGQRLKLIRSKVNSGSAGTPRNIGLGISRGDYIFFMDADDIITETAMEELYNTALKFDTDILHCEKYYKAPDETVTTDKNLLKISSYEKVEFVTTPTFVSNNLADRVNDFTNFRFWNAPWIHFIRREFLMENNISFPNIAIGDDIMFNFYVICLAKNILRIPNVYYVWRDNKNSNTRAALSVEKYIRRYGNSVMKAIGIIDQFTNKIEFFRQYPEFKFKMFDFFTREHLTRIYPIYAQIPAFQLDSLIRRELEQIEDKTELTAFLFARMNIFNVNLIQQQNLIRQQQAQIQQLQSQIQQAQKSFNFNTEDIFKLN